MSFPWHEFVTFLIFNSFSLLLRLTKLISFNRTLFLCCFNSAWKWAQLLSSIRYLVCIEHWFEIHQRDACFHLFWFFSFVCVIGLDKSVGTSLEGPRPLSEICITCFLVHLTTIPVWDENEAAPFDLLRIRIPIWFDRQNLSFVVA